MGIWINGFEDRLTKGAIPNLVIGSTDQNIPLDNTNYFEVVDGQEFGSAIRRKTSTLATVYGQVLTLFNAFGSTNGGAPGDITASATDEVSFQIKFKVEALATFPDQPPFDLDPIFDFARIKSSTSSEPDHFRLQLVPSNISENNASTFSTFYIQLARAAANSLGYEAFGVMNNSLMVMGQWYTLRGRILLHASAGEIDLYLHKGSDPTPQTSLISVGINTTGTNAATTARAFALGTIGGISLDDFYLATAADAAVLPELLCIATMYPTDPAFVTDWTNSSPGETNAQVLDEATTLDGKTISSAVVGDADLYPTTFLPFNGPTAVFPTAATVPFVSMEAIGSSVDGLGEIRFQYRNASTVDFVGYDSDLFTLNSALSSAPVSTQAHSAVIPGTASAWTTTDAEAYHFGLEHTA